MCYPHLKFLGSLNVNPNFKYYHFVCQQYLELIQMQCVNTYKTTPVLYFYFAKPLAIDV